MTHFKQVKLLKNPTTFEFYSDILGASGDPPTTYLQYKSQLVSIIIRALTIEGDTNNTQMLLGKMGPQCENNSCDIKPHYYFLLSFMSL